MGTSVSFSLLLFWYCQVATFCVEIIPFLQLRSAIANGFGLEITHTNQRKKNYILKEFQI